MTRSTRAGGGASGTTSRQPAGRRSSARSPARAPSRAPDAGGENVYVGISGWRYPEWRGVFYPEDLAHRRELEFASRAVRTIEINGSFYSLQRLSSWLTWYAETPADYVFAVKGSGFISHNKKLQNCREALANFFASGVLALEDKLGPILWQLPPQLRFDPERIEAFFASLPGSTAAAAELAREHDGRVKHGVYLDVRGDWPIRYALEPRHPSFDDPALRAILRKYDVALAIADTAGEHPAFEDVNASHVYVRLHGSRELYRSGYTSAELDRWAERITEWRRGDDRLRDVFVYFDNDADVRAPFDAMNLAARFGHGRRVAFPRARMRAVHGPRARPPMELRAPSARRSPPPRPSRSTSSPEYSPRR